MQRNENTVWREFIEAFKYCIDSKKGLFSLETYLEIVGEYTDRVILSEEEVGKLFVGGTCTVKKSRDKDFFKFDVELLFKDQNNQYIKKETSRELPYSKFVRETKNIVGDKTLTYDIEQPERRA